VALIRLVVYARVFKHDQFASINNPSYTAHPMAELATLRESLSEAPSKKPETPRC